MLLVYGNIPNLCNFYIQMLEFKEVTLLLGRVLSVNILGALVYRPQDKKADKRIAEDNSEKTDEKMAEDNSVESH